MKVKTLLIIALLFLQWNFVFSQCISIELSVTWKMGYDIFNKDSVISIPMLNITYRNNCDTNYYFFKVSPRKDGYSMVRCYALRNIFDHELQKIAKSYQYNYTNRAFNVLIGKGNSINKAWEIVEDTIEFFLKDPSKERISCALQDIYQYLCSERYNKSTKNNHKCFEPSIVTPENILSGSGLERFVFLKPNETHIDTYNLIGYKFVEGSFTFHIDQNVIKNYVLGLDAGRTIEIKLPAVVGEYQLYSGSFNTNKVTVCFGEK